MAVLVTMVTSLVIGAPPPAGAANSLAVGIGSAAWQAGRYNNQYGPSFLGPFTFNGVFVFGGSRYVGILQLDRAVFVPNTVNGGEYGPISMIGEGPAAPTGTCDAPLFGGLLQSILSLIPPGLGIPNPTTTLECEVSAGGREPAAATFTLVGIPGPTMYPQYGTSVTPYNGVALLTT